MLFLFESFLKRSIRPVLRTKTAVAMAIITGNVGKNSGMASTSFAFVEDMGVSEVEEGLGGNDGLGACEGLIKPCRSLISLSIAKGAIKG